MHWMSQQYNSICIGYTVISTGVSPSIAAVVLILRPQYLAITITTHPMYHACMHSQSVDGTVLFTLDWVQGG